MTRNKIMLAALVAVAAAATGVPHAAMAATEIWVQTAPPPLRHEVVPAARRGYVWAPGHWNWQRDRYVWQSGVWVRERPGYVYSAPAWVEHEGRWQMQGGRWDRHDRDHDGVPNAVDRRPNDPTRR